MATSARPRARRRAGTQRVDQVKLPVPSSRGFLRRYFIHRTAVTGCASLDFHGPALT